MSLSVVHASLYCPYTHEVLVVMCLLKWSLLSSIPSRYLTIESICMRSLPAISGNWILSAAEVWNQMLCIHFWHLILVSSHPSKIL